MARITLDHLAHSYRPDPRGPEDYALKEIDHVWRNGGAYALLGPSGCGKTTLLNIISGLVVPSRGRVLFDGRDVTEEPTEVADILIDLVQRETRTFSNRFARQLIREMKPTVRMHKNPLKSAGFRVLKAPDVPSVLIELGYVSNKSDLEHLVSDAWRSRTVGAVAQAIDTFFAKRVVSVGASN